MVAVAGQTGSITTDEVRIVSVDMSGLLDAGELLTGAPTIQSDANLTTTNAQLNTTAVTIDGASVAAGMAVQFTINSAISGAYWIEIVCGTDAAQTIEAKIKIHVSSSLF